MKVINSTCDKCGDIALAPKAVLLRLTSSGDHGFFFFDCPFCERPHSGYADHVQTSKLMGMGVVYVLDSSLDEKAKRRGKGAGKRITEEEIVEFARKAESSHRIRLELDM